ncbi:MAG: hypothetical protein J6Z04_04095 [Clostridia bacterium]|nr:hypothetical protein [Clostridia bacterium]
MKNRFISFLLVVLTVFTALILPVTASEPEPPEPAPEANYETATQDALQKQYPSVKEKLTADVAAGFTELYAQTDKYQLFCNKFTGEVFLRDRATGQYLTTNPTDVKSASQADRLSQVWISYKTFETNAVEKRYTSFEMAAKKGQISVSRIKGGLRVEYTMGDVTSRYVAPQAILETDFQETILIPLEKKILSVLNYEFITTWFSTFVNPDNDPVIDEVYQRLNELEETGDIETFRSAVSKILGTYSTSKQKANDNINSRFYHDYKTVYDKVKADLNSSDVAKRTAAKEKELLMLEQIHLLVPGVTELPSPGRVGVELNKLYADIGNLNADYGGNLIDINPLMADPDKNKAEIEAYQKEYPILQKTPEDGEPYPLIRWLVFSRDPSQEGNTIAYFKKIEKYFANSLPDYTLSTMLEQEEKVGYDALVFDNPLFRCAIEYTLDDTGMTVDIPASSIVFDEAKYQLTELSFLRYFNAGETKQDGYIFYPDGSGALIYNKTMPSSAVIDQPIYSYDYAYAKLRLSKYVGSVNSSQPVRLPVFGAVNSVDTGEKDADDNPIKKDVGYLAIITEGESLARVVATHLDSDGAFVGAYASYTLRASDNYTIGRLKGGDPVPITADFKYTGRFTQKYVMLTGDPDGYRADYVGMANAYRDYLFGKETISALDAAELKERLPLYIETYATVETVDSVLSFPVTVNKPLTSFADVKTMGDDLREAGVGNVKFRLIGYYNDGYMGYYPNRVKWMKEIGGKKGFKSLVKYVEEHADEGFETFTDVDLLYNYRPGKIGGISRKKNAARSMDDRYVRKVMYSTVYRSTTSNMGLLISASRLADLFKKFDKKFSKFKATSISLANLASDLSSNFNEDDYFTREEAKALVSDVLETASGKYSVMATGGNVYTLPYVDYLLSAPVDGSHFNSVSRTVPFFGMVMHGALQYAGEVFNEAGNPDYELLRDVESGAAMYVVLVYRNTDLMKEDSELIKHYAANYGYWRDDLVSYYDILDYAIGDLQTYRITDHRFLSGERKIQDWEAEEDTKVLEEEYFSLLERQYLEQIRKRNELITQLWYITVPLENTTRDQQISSYATTLFNGSYGTPEQQQKLKDVIAAIKDTYAPGTSDRAIAPDALRKLIDPADPVYDAGIAAIGDPEEVRKSNLARDLLSGKHGTEAMEKITAIVEAIDPDYALETTSDADKRMTESAAVKKLIDPTDPEYYGVVLGNTKVQVTIDADAIKAEAKNLLNVEELSEWLSDKIDAFASEYASAAGIMPFTVSGVENYATLTEYSFVTDSEADAADYKKTSYTISDGSIVLVTYSNGAETVRFLLNFGIFTVDVKLGGETYTLGKYDFIRLDPRADGKTDPRNR